MPSFNKGVTVLKKKAFGTYNISKICHVAPITVGRWIEEGKLPYFTTGGGHRRVWEADLLKFLKAHNYPIPSDMKTGRPSILVIEDEASVRRSLRRALEKELPFMQVEEAMDGYEAGEKILSITPIVVVLDINMPGLNGLKVCERIRRNKSHKNVKIVAMSSEPTPAVKEKILKAGADAFLSKPLDLDSFLKIVRSLAGIK